MTWLIILAILLSLIAWLLVSSVVIEIDTRIPRAGMKWTSIANANAWYDGAWWLNFRVFFFHKTICLSETKSKPNKKRITQKKSKKNVPVNRRLKKIIAVAETFRVTKWQLAIDTGNYISNAKLYPLNYLPHTFQHVHINFTDENYLVLNIRNRPWKILYAFLR